MQRFNDFTKKSVKVVSAVLSAAMVTSMVAGTNVLYAATDEVTEATEEVAKTDTENQDKKAVDRAIAEYIAKVKKASCKCSNSDIY